MTGREVWVEPDTLLDRCTEKPVAVSWPFPVDQRLDGLRAAVEREGVRTSRKQLLAAIVFCCDADGEALAGMLRRYLKGTARDAVLDATEADNVLRLPRHRSGPRGRESPG